MVSIAVMSFAGSGPRVVDLAGNGSVQTGLAQDPCYHLREKNSVSYMIVHGKNTLRIVTLYANLKKALI